MEYDPIPTLSRASAVADRNPYRQPPRNPDPPAKKTRFRRLLVWCVIPLVTALLAVAAGVVVGATIKKPEVESLKRFEHRLVTQVRDRKGEVFQTYSRENRILIDPNEMPELLSQAIIAAEDSNFYLHGGIDLKGILRAAYTNFRAGRTKEGASTLTMQVARQVFLNRKREWKRKIEEAFLAVELEKRYSKQQILTLWANLQNMSHGNYGMEAAARDYFNKSVGDLTLAEAATLAGIPNRPSYYAIRTRPEEVKKRRNHVLGRMLDTGFITKEQYEEAVAEPLLVAPRHRERQMGPYFAEEVRRYLATAYGTTALYDRGLVVETTLDPDIQQAAEDALHQGLVRLDHNKGWRGAKEHMDDEDLEHRALPSWTGAEIVAGEWYEGIVLESTRKAAQVKIDLGVYELRPEGFEWTKRSRPDQVLKRGDVAWFRFEAGEKEGDDWVLHLEQEPVLEGAVLVLDSATGAVRAMVGGWNFDRNEFNRATQAHRQVGSAFKPFIFGAALENGFTPADTIFDGPAVFRGADNLESYSPRNYYRKYYGITTLRHALEASINVTSVKLMDLVGIQTVIDFARRCGLRSELPPYPSLALGSADLSPMELAAAYTTFVNRGIYVEPYLIEKISTSEGRVLQDHMPRAHQAMDPRQAYVVTQLLRGVALRGTAAGGPYGLAKIDLDLAGKTGTTNDYSDAWFVGFTPRLTLLAWVGHDQKRRIGRGATGAAAALPIWTTLVRRGIDEGWIPTGETFERPPGIVERVVESRTGLLFTPGSPGIPLNEFFVEGNEPEKKFDEHWARIVDLPWYLQEPFYLPKEGERMPSQIQDWTMVQEVWVQKNKEQG